MLYAWMDLETTGLDEANDAVLELGITITGGSGSRADLAPFKHLLPSFSIRDNIASVVIAPATSLPKMPDVVREMHTRSGLLEEVALAKATAPEVERQLIALFDAMKIAPREITIAGNTIHFDWRFLKRVMPTFVSRLHYRMLDMSAVALFADGMGIPRPEKRAVHRVTDDIEESLDYLRYYRESLRVA